MLYVGGTPEDICRRDIGRIPGYGPRGGQGGQRQNLRIERTPEVGAHPHPPMSGNPHGGSYSGYESGHGDWDYEDMNAQVGGTLADKWRKENRELFDRGLLGFVGHGPAMAKGDGGGGSGRGDWDDDMGAPVARVRAQRYQVIPHVSNSVANWKSDGYAYGRDDGDPEDAMDMVMAPVGSVLGDFKDKYLTKRNLLIGGGILALLVAGGIVMTTMKKKKPAVA